MVARLRVLENERPQPEKLAVDVLAGLPRHAEVFLAGVECHQVASPRVPS